MPSWRKNKTPSVIKARVLSVDKVRSTMEVCGENNERYTMPCPATYVGGKGQGSFHMPEQNSLMYICSPSDGTTPFFVAGCAVPHEQDDDESDQDDFRQARPVLNEGDQMVASSDDGNFIILRKGGVLEVGASQTAQRLYVPINSLIQDYCQDYLLQTAGGLLEWKSRRDDETWGGGAQTPAELRLQIKDFTGEDAIIDIGLGRIQDEDDEACGGGAAGDVVARLLINDSYQVWIDKRGNVTSNIVGEAYYTHEAKVVETCAKSRFMKVLGIFQSNLGARQTTVSGDDMLEVNGNRTMTVHGDLTETIDGKYTRNVKGHKDDIDGSRETAVRGFETKTVSGYEDKTVTDDKITSVGKGYKEVVGGKRSFKVTNSQVADEPIGFEVVLAAGEIRILSMTGPVRIIAGGVDELLALSVVTIKETGTIILESTPASGLGKLEVNTTGASLSTPAGEITIDLAGSVSLGPAGQGAVVTTLTHPTCYVTGAPILGSTSVGAGGIPGPTVIPTTFMADT